MNNLKKNIKLIVLIIIIILISSGVGVFATYNYLASDVKYTESKTVEQALDDLYNKSANYILPSGTKTITSKENNIDVSNYKYVDTTGLYTASEYNAKTGQGTYWDYGSKTVTGGQDYTINLRI